MKLNQIISYGSDDLLSQIQSFSIVMSSSAESNRFCSTSSDTKDSNYSPPAWHADCSR